MVCRNKTVDERGYTIYISFSYNEGKETKIISTMNESNKLVEQKTYDLHKGKEYLSMQHLVYKDSTLEQRNIFNKKYTKQKQQMLFKGQKTKAVY